MGTPRLRLGQLLVDARMISEQALGEVLAIQRGDGRRLGTLLVEQGFINETQLTQILSHQLAVPWVSLLHIEFSRQLLNLVPREVAERYCLVPIYVRHVRNQGETLYVAMDDPTNEDGLQECGLYSGLPVRAMIAPPTDIRSAIRVYYGGSRAPVASPTISDAPETEPDLGAVPVETLRSRRESISEAATKAAAAAPEPAQAVIDRVAAGAPDLSDGPEIAVVDDETIDDDLDSHRMLAGEVEEEISRPTLESVPSDDLLDASRPPRAHTRPIDQEFLEGADLRRAPSPPPPAAPEAEPAAEPAAVAAPEAVAETEAAPEAVAETEAAPEAVAETEAEPEAAAETEAEPEAAAEPEAQADIAPRSSGRGGVRAPVAALLGAVLGRGRDEQGPGSAPASTEAARDEAPSEREVESIPQPRARPRRMISLTLLDGTNITLPARNRAGRPPSEAPAAAPEGEDSGLTARDLVSALRAVSHGADATEILGNNVRWEAMFAALLSLLLKKQLIADWEFVEELKKF